VKCFSRPGRSTDFYHQRLGLFGTKGLQGHAACLARPGDTLEHSVSTAIRFQGMFTGALRRLGGSETKPVAGVDLNNIVVMPRTGVLPWWTDGWPAGL